jgi:glycosyltransferase involved in cell wall biosynthesis
MNRITLSITIPTYNRANKVVELVENILQYFEDDIEVIVIDNKSIDSTILDLSKIKDRRLIVIENEINIGSMPNIIKSLKFGNGKYLMLCLDKDWIDFQNLGKLIFQLKLDELAFGSIELNCERYLESLSYTKGINSIQETGYKSQHPSGLIINREILFRHNILEKISNFSSLFPFYPDLIKSELSLLGNSKIFRFPLIITESLEDCKSVNSHTYLNDNIYFSPIKIIERFNVFILHIFSLDLNIYQKKKIVSKIFYRYLFASTIDYKNVLVDESICFHHNILPRVITKRELLFIINSYNSNLLKNKFIDSFIWKFKIIFVGNFKLIYWLIFHEIHVKK